MFITPSTCYFEFAELSLGRGFGCYVCALKSRLHFLLSQMLLLPFGRIDAPRFD